jgi:hypothetical protein
MCPTGSLLLVLAAPPTLADVPAVDRSRPHFYGAVADNPVTAAWAVAPAGDEVVLTLTLTGVANPAEVTKPDLQAVSVGRFQVLPLPDPPAGDPLAFRYAVRPLAAGRGVPAFPFAYYRPAFPDGRRFVVAYADPVPLPPVPLPPVPPPAVPAIDLPPVPPAGRAVPGWAWLVPAAGVLPVVLAGTPLARRLFPDAARRAALQRRADVRQALGELAAAAKSPDPATAASVAVRRFLAGRPAGEFSDLLAECDRVRFGPAGASGLSLPAAAAELVARAAGR